MPKQHKDITKMDSKENTTPNNQYILWLIYATLALLLAFALRIYGIYERALWLDEVVEYWMAVVPLNEIHQSVAEATHDPPLYSYFLHFWMSMGLDEFFLRIPSLYFSMLGIAGIARLAKREFNQTTALTAVILLAVSTADIRYAQETGQYALMVGLLTFNLLFLYQTKRDNGWRSWILWGTTSLVSIYSFYGTTIFILATASAFLFYNLWKRQWAAVKKQIISGTITLFLTLPLILIIIPQQLGRLGAARLPIIWEQFLSISAKIIAFQWLGNQQLLGWPWPQIPSWFGWLPVVIAIIIALVKSKSITAPPILLIFTWLIYYAISRSGAYFFSGTRHSLFITPLLILSAAIGITMIGRKYKILSLLLISPILLISLLTPREGQEDLRSVAHYWQENSHVDDATFVYYGAAPGFQYQLDVANENVSNLPRHWYLDCWGNRPEAHYCNDNNIHYGRWTRGKAPDEREALVVEVIGSESDRLWLVFAHTRPGEQEELVQALATRYTFVSEQLFEGASLVLLDIK